MIVQEPGVKEVRTELKPESTDSECKVNLSCISKGEVPSQAQQVNSVSAECSACWKLLSVWHGNVRFHFLVQLEVFLISKAGRQKAELYTTEV